MSRKYASLWSVALMFSLIAWGSSGLLAVEKKQPVDWVDPILGTASSRWMLYPGPSMPFSMVKLSPDNQKQSWKAGYEYRIENIAGFSHIHSWTMAGLLTMPITGKLQTVPGPENDPDKGYRSRFSHDTEVASPGYYAVTLEDYGIRAELTSTTRAGFQRYTFPKADEAYILFDLKFPTEYGFEVLDACIKRVSDVEISGYSKQQAGRGAKWNDYTVYFVVKFSKPFNSFGGWTDETIHHAVNKVAGKEPYLGPQDDPVPGVHNSGWVPSPGLKRVTDRSVWPDLERYVKDIVGAFGQDPRILIWDLYNEPGNSGMGPKSLPLAEAAFAWAREVHPIQPLTTGAWTNFDSPMSKRIMALSDIISFHGYDQPDGMVRKIKTCRNYGRPVICTEWLRRQVGNTVASILPLFAKHQVGWYHWGLVAGRTQTYMHWGSKRGDPTPEVWQHDTFHQNGTPYNLRELELIQAFRFPRDTQTWNSVYLQNDCIRLQVVPECGGRIMQYSLGEHDFFWNNDTLINVKPPATGLGSNGQWLNYGGEKLWPAPQGWDNDEQWPGPPDAVLDGQPYTLEKLRGKRGEAAIRLTGRKDQRSGIQFSRVVRVFEGGTRVNFEATMKNIDTRPRRWGIWSHTQLDGGKADGSGHNPLMKAWCPINPDSRFTKGYSVIFGKPNNPTFQPDTQRGLMQVQYQYKVGKIGLDSHAGWVATVEGESGAVFVQRFVFEPDKEYPDGSSVEFWLNGLGKIHAYNRDMVMSTNPEENPYVFESEVLSPFAQLQPGESYMWSYDWYAANIGGDFPVLDCSDAGVVAEPLSVELSSGQAKLKGRFGVFDSGAVSVEFADAQGRTLQTLDLPLNVSPLKPVVLDNIVLVPADAASVRLLLIGTDGKTVGELAKADLSKTEAGAHWSPEKAW